MLPRVSGPLFADSRFGGVSASQTRNARCTRGWLSRSKCPARGRCSRSASGEQAGVADNRPGDAPYAEGWRTSRSPSAQPTGWRGDRLSVAETRW